MKKLHYYILVIALMALAQLCYAQNERQEAEKEVRNASTAIQEKKYLDAVYALDNAKKKVVKLLSNEVAAALPVKVGNWVYEDTPGMNIGISRSQSRINVVKNYVKESNKEASEENLADGTDDAETQRMLAMDNPSEPIITVTITDDYSHAVAVSRAHSEGENLDGFTRQNNETSDPIKVKGYRALLLYNNEIKHGSLTIIVGASIVRIEGQNIETKDILQKFAEAVDFKLIKSILGE